MSMDTTPAQVDKVLDEVLNPEDELLEHVRFCTSSSGLPEIEVSAQQGKMLEVLVSSAKATNILEVGTLAGYSTICLARGAGPDGQVTTLEYETKHAMVAMEHINLAGLRDRVELVVGAAADTMNILYAEIQQGLRKPYDFIFIDADKDNNELYMKWASALGTQDVTVLVDNVIRDGRVIDPHRPEKLAFIEYLSTSDWNSSVVQTVGAKGWDGFVLATRS